MTMWDSVPLKKNIFQVLHIQIGLVNYVKENLLDFVDSDAEKLSIGEEVPRNTLLTLNQVISKIWQNRQI